MAIPKEKEREMSKVSHPASGFVVSFATTLINIGIAVVASILVYISYLFEVSAYSALLGPVIGSRVLEDWQLTGAEFLAIGLNGAKVALIFIIAHLASEGLQGRFQLKLLRGLVLLLSLLMTLFVFAGQTVSPKAEARLQELQSAINDRYEASIDLANGRFDTQRSQVIERFEEELELLGTEHTVRLEELNTQLDAERGVGGQAFFGERYKELLRLIQDQQDNFAAHANTLRGEERMALDRIEQERAEELRARSEAYETEYASIRLDDIYGTSEAQSPHMLRMVSMARTIVASEQVTPATVTVFLTVLVSLIIELLPIAMFGHVFRVLLGHRTEAMNSDHAAVLEEDSPDSAAESFKSHDRDRDDGRNFPLAAE